MRPVIPGPGQRIRPWPADRLPCRSWAKARVISVNVGRAVGACWAGGLKRTAIGKRPVTGTGPAGTLGLAGDEQPDTAHHGGPGQAIYACARENLDWRAARLGRELRNGMFGENVSTAGADLSGALIGEIRQFGTAVPQVTAPRIRCVVFRNWMDENGWIPRFRAAGRPGPYLRCAARGCCGPATRSGGCPARPRASPWPR